LDGSISTEAYFQLTGCCTAIEITVVTIVTVFSRSGDSVTTDIETGHTGDFDTAD
jgi:hypothetical protein